MSVSPALALYATLLWLDRVIPTTHWFITNTFIGSGIKTTPNLQELFPNIKSVPTKLNLIKKIKIKIITFYFSTFLLLFCCLVFWGISLNLRQFGCEKLLYVRKLDLLFSHLPHLLLLFLWGPHVHTVWAFDYAFIWYPGLLRTALKRVCVGDNNFEMLLLTFGKKIFFSVTVSF